MCLYKRACVGLTTSFPTQLPRIRYPSQTPLLITGTRHRPCLSMSNCFIFLPPCRVTQALHILPWGPGASHPLGCLPKFLVVHSIPSVTLVFGHGMSILQPWAVSIYDINCFQSPPTSDRGVFSHAHSPKVRNCPSPME